MQIKKALVGLVATGAAAALAFGGTAATTGFSATSTDHSISAHTGSMGIYVSNYDLGLVAPLVDNEGKDLNCVDYTNNPAAWASVAHHVKNNSDYPALLNLKFANNKLSTSGATASELKKIHFRWNDDEGNSGTLTGADLAKKVNSAANGEWDVAVTPPYAPHESHNVRIGACIDGSLATDTNTKYQDASWSIDFEATFQQVSNISSN